MITDRKNSIITDISNLIKNLDQIKNDQFFGHDTTQLQMITNDNDYDVSLSIPVNGRAMFEAYCLDTLSIDPNHIQSYSQILYQVFVNNINNPYIGESSGIGIFSPNQTFSPYAPGSDMITFEMVNSGGSSTITIYVKIYAITTLPKAEVTLQGYLE